MTVIAANVAGRDTQELTVTVLEPPVVTSVTPATFSVGAGGSYAITAAGYPAPVITAETTPAGLELTDQGDGTATLSGTPTGPAATSAVRITAASAVGEATAILTVVVDAAPVFTSDDLVEFDRGVGGSFDITATGDPAPSITTEDPLPAGLTLVDHGDGTATVAGTPSVDGAFVVDLTAPNGAGTARQGLSIQINSAPDFRSAETAEFTEEAPGSFSVEADGYPAPTLTLQGELPAGLTFADHSDGTAVIAGTPEAGRAGRYPVTLTATNRDPVAEGVAGRATGTAEQDAGDHRRRGPEQCVAEPDRPGQRPRQWLRRGRRGSRHRPRGAGQHGWTRPRGRRNRCAARPCRGGAGRRVPAPERPTALSSAGLADRRHVEVGHPDRRHHGAGEEVVPLPAQGDLGGPDLGDPAEQLDR